MGTFVNIAETRDVPPGKAAAFTVGDKQIAIFNVDGTFYAIDDICPHAGASLCEGEVSGTKVTCPWHAAEFDLRSGAPLRPPEAVFAVTPLSLWAPD